MNYCKAVLRPEGIACSLRAGHDRQLDERGTVWDHANKPPTYNAGPRFCIGKQVFYFKVPTYSGYAELDKYYWNDPSATINPTDENTESLR